MRALLLCSILLIVLVACAEMKILPTEELTRPATRGHRVKRQWMSAWSGWRCAGVNGLFLDCMGKK